MGAGATARIASLVRQSRSVIALTGAGLSTASGIPDFRSPGTGLWSRVDPMEVASIQAFRRDPVRFWSFYSQRLAALRQAEPNPAHRALARLEALDLLDGLITQNIDRLHRRAGSRRLAEVHGSIDSAQCLTCGSVYPHERMVRDLARPGGIPTCDCGAVLKPGVVLFGEGLPGEPFEQAVAWLEAADLLVVAGTSLEVYPVAGLPEIVLRRGGRMVVVNATPTRYDAEAALVVRDRVEEVLPELLLALADRSAA